MTVNTSKTAMLCISDAMLYKARVFIEDGNGERVDSGETMRYWDSIFPDDPICMPMLTLYGRDSEEITGRYTTSEEPVLRRKNWQKFIALLCCPLPIIVPLYIIV